MKLSAIKANIEERVKADTSLKTLLAEIIGTKVELVLAEDQRQLWEGVTIYGVYLNKHQAARLSEKLPRQVADPGKKLTIAEAKSTDTYAHVKRTIALAPVRTRCRGKKAFVVVYDKTGERDLSTLRCEEVIETSAGPVTLYG